MSLTLADIRGLFTKTLIDVYQERPQPTLFLQSFFPVETSPTKLISIEVERMGEKVAVDVVRGTEGNRNQFVKATEKIFEPPFYREYFDMTELDLYDRVLGSQGGNNKPLFKQLVKDAAYKMDSLVDKFRRTKEIQAAQIFSTGVVTTRFGGSIDFKRKPGSIVAVPADYFATNSDPFAVFEKGCNFLRQVGRSAAGTYQALMGSSALSDLLKNTAFLQRQNLFNMALDGIVAPKGTRDAEGNTFHGTITCGAYRVQLWAYPQFYDLNTGTDEAPVYVSTPYLDPKSVVLIPAVPRFKMAHAAVPQLLGAPGQGAVQGEYVFSEFIDDRKAKHIMDVQTAFIALPSAIDTIYTFKAVA